MDYFPTTSLFPFIDQPLHFTIEFFDFAYTPNPGPDCATTFFFSTTRGGRCGEPQSAEVLANGCISNYMMLMT